MDNFNESDISSHNGSDSRPKPEKADLTLRCIAFMIDHMIIVISLIAWLIIILLVESSMDSAPVGIMWLFFMLFFLSCYFLKDTFKGASPGKHMLGLAVRKHSNPLEPPSFFKLAIRNTFTFLSWPVDFLFLICSKEKRKLGDKIADTDVYRVSNSLKASWIAAFAASIVAVLIFSVFAAPSIMFRNDSSYKTAVSYIETTPKIMEYVGDVKGYSVSSNGSLYHSEGYGSAVYNIKVKGTRNTMRVHIKLEKNPWSDWEITYCRY